MPGPKRNRYPGRRFVSLEAVFDRGTLVHTLSGESFHTLSVLFDEKQAWEPAGVSGFLYTVHPFRS